MPSQTAEPDPAREGEGGGDRRKPDLNGTRQTAAGEEEAAASASRPEVEAEAGCEAVAAVAMGPRRGGRARDGIWGGRRARVSWRRVLRSSRDASPACRFVLWCGRGICNGDAHAAAVALGRGGRRSGQRLLPRCFLPFRCLLGLPLPLPGRLAR